MVCACAAFVGEEPAAWRLRVVPDGERLVGVLVVEGDRDRLPYAVVLERRR